MTHRPLTRRHFLQAMSVLATPKVLAIGDDASANGAEDHRNRNVEYGKDTLPAAIRSRRVDTNNGVVLHILEAGFESAGKPCLMLLHGFPELAYSWRNQLLPLARAGFHVVAPDLRGCGLSAIRPVRFDDDLLPYSMLNRVADVLGLVRALGYKRVAAVVGHDWGGPTAQWCARLRPDVFRSVVSVSTPFFQSPNVPLGAAENRVSAASDLDIEKALEALPRPRKHYAWYYSTQGANEDMWRAPQGVHDLLRGYYYFKSADWEGNRPYPLKGWTAVELAKLPAYYIMDLEKGVAATVSEYQPSSAYVAACKWMTEADLKVFSREFQRTGFQGGLNYYRIDGVFGPDSGLNAYSGKTINVPACFIGGASDWAVYQSPGAFESMHSACTQLMGVHLVKGAGHSVVEEQSEAVNGLLVTFLEGSRTG